MKIRYVTPSGALFEITIASALKDLPDWKIRSHVIKELKDRYIDFKSFKILE